jgi:transposase
MPQNFIECDREQVLLMAPSLRDWLPEDHFVWFVVGAVEEMDLAGFYGAYRLDGHGRPAHDPAMMVALLLYGYAKGQRSSRVIERECVEDIAYRVIAANEVPDHARAADDITAARRGCAKQSASSRPSGPLIRSRCRALARRG